MGCHMLQDGKYTFEDKRDWVEYNERLVRRGEFYFSFDFLRSWDHELDTLNVSKGGRPFEYPPSFIHFSAVIHEVFHLPYRQMEGIFRQLGRYIPELKPADYTTLFKRITKLEIKIENEGLPEEIVLAVDSSGIKVTNSGDWIRKKWKVRKGWLKVHIAVDTKTKKLLALEITDESVGDNKKFKDLLEQAEENASDSKIVSSLADGGYDTKELFNLLDEKEIKAGIKTRKNAITIAKGSPYRAKCIRELREIGYDAWKEKYQYGQRWASEGYLSAFKRLFGESVKAKSNEGMINEIKRKFVFYNSMLNLY
jgi:hypothetical protein